MTVTTELETAKMQVGVYVCVCVHVCMCVKTKRCVCVCVCYFFKTQKKTTLLLPTHHTPSFSLSHTYKSIKNNNNNNRWRRCAAKSTRRWRSGSPYGPTWPSRARCVFLLFLSINPRATNRRNTLIDRSIDQYTYFFILFCGSFHRCVCIHIKLIIFNLPT